MPAGYAGAGGFAPAFTQATVKGGWKCKQRRGEGGNQGRQERDDLVHAVDDVITAVGTEVKEDGSAR